SATQSTAASQSRSATQSTLASHRPSETQVTPASQVTTAAQGNRASHQPSETQYEQASQSLIETHSGQARHPMNPEIKILKAMVRGAYDLQLLRIQCGLRLCANFRAKLKLHEGEEPADDGELSPEAERLVDTLKASYRRLTDGVARNRTLPT